MFGVIYRNHVDAPQRTSYTWGVGKYSQIRNIHMKIESIKPTGAPKAASAKPLEEKKAAAPVSISDDISSIYGIDVMDADMQRKLRVLRKADPELYRKITNLD